MKTNTAYDFTRFETAAPRVRVVKNDGKKRVKKSNIKAFIAFYLVLIIALMCFTVYNQAVLTETRSAVNNRKNQISKYENDYSALEVKLESMVSLKDAETYAVSELGLRKVAGDQIVYVNLQNENVIENGESTQAALETIKSVFGTVVDYFNP